MKKGIIFLIILVGSFIAPIYGQELYVGLFCFTKNLETKKEHQADLLRQTKNFEAIASICNWKPHISIFSGENLTVENVMNWVKIVPADGTSIFYYTGQEAAVKNSNSIWPHLSCHDGEVSKETLITQLKSKKPRLSVVLFDCYDTVCHDVGQHVSIPKVLQPAGKERRGIEYLFKKQKGFVVAASAPSGKRGYGLSFGEKECGGLFTLMLNQSFSASTYRPRFFEAVLSEVCSNCYHLVPNKEKFALLKQELLIEFS